MSIFEFQPSESKPFRDSAPSAQTVFSRTYGRRKEDGTRENFHEAMTRTINDIARIGKLGFNHHVLIMEQALAQRTFPSGRAFWVAGTEWGKKPENFNGYYNCLGADTLVQTHDGLVRIQELAGNEGTTKVLNGNGRWVDVKFRNYGKQSLIPVTFGQAGGSTQVIRSTPNHRWITRRGVVPTTELRRGDKIAKVYAPKPTASLMGVRDGIIYGDGTTQYGKFFVDLVGEKAELSRYFDDVRQYKHTRAYVDTTHNAKELPYALYNPNYLRGWIQGLIATDGSVTGSVVIHGTAELAAFLADRAAIAGFTFVSSRIAARAGEKTNFGERKQDLWAIVLDKDSIDVEDLLRHRHRARLRKGSAKRWWTVKSIGAEEAPEDVYCTEEPETHSFVLAHGLLTGNCSNVHMEDLEAFGLLVDLAMQGTGTGAILEQNVIDRLPAVSHKLEIVSVTEVGSNPDRRAETVFDTLLPSGAVSLSVGDSRKGWQDAYQLLINWAHEGLEGHEGHIRVHLDLGNVRPSGERLKGFGGTSNPVKLESMFRKVADLLNTAVGRKLTTVEACLLIDEAATAIVAGNIRRSAGMRQFSQNDEEAATAKLGLYSQDEDGNWRVDPKKEALRMANHTRCYHTKPSYQAVEDAVRLQFSSGEGAIQYVPEAVARANADLLGPVKNGKKAFLQAYTELGRDAAKKFLLRCAEETEYRMDERELNHRMDRYGLNPCFAPGTIVMTRDGYRPIESLVGQTVEIHDGNEWRFINNFRVTAEDQDVYDLELHDGTVITATEYHKFILADGTRKELKDLVAGDELMAAKVKPVKGTVAAKGAYLKGFLIGDGTSDRGQGAICKVYEPKKICVDRLKDSQAELGMTLERRANGRDVGGTGLTPGGYLKGLTATGEDLNPWCSTYKHEFPYEVLNWTDKAKYEFLAGLFDADGTARDGGTSQGISYQITSISRPFLQGLVTLLRTLGIASKIGPVRAGGLKDFGPERGGVYEVKPTYRLAIAKAGSVKLAQSCVFERLKSFADREVLKPQKLKSNRVKSITFSHNAPEVYCCTVPGTSAFTLGTLHVVSNCGEICGRDFMCNLAEIHLNTIDPDDYVAQEKAFYAGGLQVASLLQHKFTQERLQYSREIDPIVGVSFTGFFDFMVHAGGYDWLKWMMEGRKGGRALNMYGALERNYLRRWREAAHRGVKDYCEEHGIRVPNRITTVQPAGTKSLLTGASSGWHPPKAQRFIRRITLGVNDPLVPTLLEQGYSVIPAQSARDDEGNLLDDIADPRVQEVLVEIPTEVSWANLPGCDQFDLAQLPVESQYKFYMQVQQYYVDHNCSATIELREHEIPILSKLIHDDIENDGGYISAALLARFDVDGGTFPRLPFEPITKEKYDELMQIQELSGTDEPFLDTLNSYDSSGWSIESVAGCSSAACLAKADADEREKNL